MHTIKRRRLSRLALVTAFALATAGLTGAAWFTSDNGPAAYAAVARGSITEPDGRWKIATGEVGYRATEKAIGLSHQVVGRTSRVSGTAEVTNDSLTHSSITVDLDHFDVHGHKHDASSTIVNASTHPVATFTQSAPIQLHGTGRQTIDVMGTLEFDGRANPATWHIDVAPDDRNDLTLVGHTDIDVTQWGVTPPSAAGVFAIDRLVQVEFTSRWTK